MVFFNSTESAVWGYYLLRTAMRGQKEQLKTQFKYSDKRELANMAPSERERAMFMNEDLRGDPNGAWDRSVPRVLLLHSQLTQAERKAVWEAFSVDGSVHTESPIAVLVCTDVASRGLDTTHVQCVINAEFPATTTSFLHRSGRTGTRFTFLCLLVLDFNGFCVCACVSFQLRQQCIYAFPYIWIGRLGRNGKCISLVDRRARAFAAHITVINMGTVDGRCLLIHCSCFAVFFLLLISLPYPFISIDNHPGRR